MLMHDSLTTKETGKTHLRILQEDRLEGRARIRNDSESLLRTRPGAQPGRSSPKGDKLVQGGLDLWSINGRRCLPRDDPGSPLLPGRRGDQMLVTTSPLVWPFTRSDFVPLRWAKNQS